MPGMSSIPVASSSFSSALAVCATSPSCVVAVAFALCSGDKGVAVLHQFLRFYLFSEAPHGARLPCFWSQSLVRGVLPRSP